MTEVKQFDNADALKTWLLRKNVSVRHANHAAPLLFDAGYDEPATFVAVRPETLREAGVSAPIAQALVARLQGAEPAIQRERTGAVDRKFYFREVLEYLEDVGGNCTDCVYSAHEDFGGHIVSEYLPYQERKIETNKITALLNARRTNWSRNKERNPLLTIPGSPGTGKSTFLAHFGMCNSISYVKAIVCTLTFNNDMPSRQLTPKDDIGLRVLFGGLRGMQCLKDKKLSWSDFCLVLSEMEKKTPISVVDAVWLLRTLHGQQHGQQRRVLILVDEIDKATAKGNQVLSELGVLLDLDRDAEVVVSAIDPDHVQSLLSASQRRISYAVLLPLSGDLIAAETKAWVASLSWDPNITRNLFKMNLIKSVHLLTSGFPRAMQRLSEEMKAGTFPQPLDGAPKTMLVHLAEAVACATKYGALIDHESLELIMGSRPIGIGESGGAEYRKLLKRNIAYVHSIEHQTIKIATTLFSLFQTSIFSSGQQDASTEKYPIVHAGHLLFQGTNSISQYFERAIDWSIFSHGIYLLTPQNMFAVKEGLEGIQFSQQPRIASSKAALTLNKNTSVEARFAAFGALEKDSVNIPPEHNPGFDSAWRLESKETAEFVFYVQAKVSKPPRKPFISAVADAIRLTLRYHSNYQQEIPLERVFMLFYLWDDVKNIPSREALLGEFVGRSCAFVEQHHANITILDRKDLATFLIPTLVHIPTLVNAVCQEEG